ncbi:sulfurtransferase [Niveibacterium sp. SC-1]|uniref:sulfurtransferase n=1 Tax=Niveibacterium sp. SC-1 TaxID=3135646 RepID=UPI00311EC0CB
MSWTALASPESLLPALASPDLRIFDCRHDLAQPDAGRVAYDKGHLPGAYFLHLDEDLSAAKTGHNGRHPLPPPETFLALMRAYGVDADTQVIAYDEGSGMFASRLWWMLRWIGHARVAVLDGGLAGWLAAGGSLETVRPAAPAPGQLGMRLQNNTVDAAELLAALGAPTPIIVDARAPDRFRGENETIDPVGGHIPGARNRFFRDNLGADGRFKPAETLRAEWQGLLAGASPDAVVSQCGSGVTACHNLLALEVAGQHGARLYPGSWSEWCADPQRPVARGA